MVLACDGLWDFVTFDHLVQLVYEHLHKKNGDRSTVAAYLMDAAMKEGSSDNISVIVVFFRENIANPKPRTDVEGAKGNDKDKPDGKGGKDGDKTVLDSNNDKTVPNSNDKVVSADDKEKQRDDVDDTGTSDDTAGNIAESGNSSADDIRIQTPQLETVESPESDDVGLQDLVEPKRVTDVMRVAIVEKFPNENLLGWSGGVVHSDQKETGNDAQLTPSISLVNALLLTSDVRSDVSSTDVHVMSHSASRCLRNRRAKRQNRTSARRKNGCRAGRDKFGRGSSSSSGGPTEGATMTWDYGSDSTQTVSTQATVKLSRTADDLLVDAGRTRYTRCKGHSVGNWTVAVEIECASAMFND